MMGRGLESGMSQEWQRSCRDGNPPITSSLSFQRKLESREAGRGVRRITRVTLAGITHGCHSRLAGMYAINHWIPACAGMTGGGLESGMGQEWQRGCQDGNPTALSSSSFRRRPESRKERPGGKGMAGLARCPHPVVTPVIIPATREWIIKPLDSGLRRATTGLLGGLFQTPLYRLHPCRRALSPHTELPDYK